MIDAVLTGTATVVWGRAAAMISAAIASAKASIGTCRRQRGRLGATDGVSGRVTNAEAASLRRCCWRTYQTIRTGIVTSATSTAGLRKLMGGLRVALPTSPGP